MNYYLITVEVENPKKAVELLHFTFFTSGNNVTEPEIGTQFLSSIIDIPGTKTIKQIARLHPKQYGDFFLTQLNEYINASSDE